MSAPLRLQSFNYTRRRKFRLEGLGTELVSLLKLRLNDKTASLRSFR
jgi:hypothetical protein